MLRRKIKVEIKTGLQAQVATEFVRKASLYTSDINILKDGRLFVAKSIINVMCLAVRKGEEITLITDGIDEHKAIQDLEEFISCKQSKV